MCRWTSALAGGGEVVRRGEGWRVERLGMREGWDWFQIGWEQDGLRDRQAERLVIARESLAHFGYAISLVCQYAHVLRAAD
jgi:hypothetical protein